MGLQTPYFFVVLRFCGGGRWVRFDEGKWFWRGVCQGEAYAPLFPFPSLDEVLSDVHFSRTIFLHLVALEFYNYSTNFSTCLHMLLPTCFKFHALIVCMISGVEVRTQWELSVWCVSSWCIRPLQRVQQSGEGRTHIYCTFCKSQVYTVNFRLFVLRIGVGMVCRLQCKTPHFSKHNLSFPYTQHGIL